LRPGVVRAGRVSAWIIAQQWLARDLGIVCVQGIPRTDQACQCRWITAKKAVTTASAVPGISTAAWDRPPFVDTSSASALVAYGTDARTRVVLAQ
jgi:hypothetical protein